MIFQTTSQFFFKFCLTLQCHETYLIGTFLAEILYTFDKRAYQSTSLVKFHVNSQKPEIIYFDGILFSKWYKFLAKNYKSTEDLSIMSLQSDANFDENFTSIGFFCPKYIRVELKKCRGVIFHDNQQWWKFWIPWPCAFRNDLRNWVNSH